MTMRERILAVIKGKKHDRVPFVQYSGLAGPNEEIWKVIGRNNMGLLRWSGVHRTEHPNCRTESKEIERNGRRGVRNTIHTPEGSIWQERVIEPTYGTSASYAHYVKEPKDYRVLMAFIRDARVSLDLEHFLRDQRELGDDGVPMVSVGRTPYQQLWVQWVSIQDLALHLVDCPEIMEECFAVLAEHLRKTFEVARQATREAPIPFINFGDNITAPTIGERNFRRYCVPMYNELADMVADKDIPIFVHMDGTLKPLWKAIGESKVRGLDSLSPPPDNDTSPGQALAMWPYMRVFINFPSSVHLAEPEKVYETARRFLEEAGHSRQFQIQISENVPPGVWKRSFPAIVRAIKDFGKP
jgi:hypothetical protein